MMACQTMSVLAQFHDDFQDRSFTGENRSVVWSGNVADFQVNDALQLQLNSSKTESNSTAQLRTANSRLQHTTWSFDVKMGVNPTSGNFVKVYLTSDEPDLIASLNGFYVRIGHTQDHLCLIRSVKGDEDQILIQGADKRVDKSSFTVNVKVILDDAGNFQLYSRLDNETDFTEEGHCTVSIGNLPEAHWFGVVCTFSGANNKKFYFDNIVVKDSDEDDPEPTPLENLPEANDLVINEILYDPPTDGEEYVELYNRSEKSIDLRYVSITTRKPADSSLNRAYPLSTSELLLLPQEYVLVTKDRTGVCSFFSCHDESLCTEPENMASLTNTGACVVILNNQTNEIIDQVNYLPAFHSIASSKQKGVALERINFEASSDDASNWTSATTASGGGTPGYINSQLNVAIETVGKIENNIQIEYPNATNANYSIRYQLDRPAYNCRIFVFDALGRKVDTIAENDILGSAGAIEWQKAGQLESGLYIIFIEAFSVDGQVQKFKVPVVVR
jgi:hypothetical protein